MNPFKSPHDLPFAPLKSRGELPHLHKEGATYFVTFRLRDALAEKKAGGTPAPQMKEGAVSSHYGAGIPPGASPPGVLVYMKTPEGNDALAWINRNGESVTESQYQILRMAECAPDTPALPRQTNHHDLVKKAVELIVAEEKTVGGQLGRPSGARFRTYERLKRYAEEVKGTLFESPELAKVIEDVYRHPLRQTAVDTLNRQLRSGISDEDLAHLTIALRQEERLCLIHEEEEVQEPKIICSLGLRAGLDEQAS